MKNLYFIYQRLPFIILLNVMTMLAHAQNLVLQIGAEKTVASNQIGIVSGLELKKQWALGGFYQTELRQTVTEGTQAINSTFYGFYLQAPLARTEKLGLFATLRTGLVENRFVVVVPSLETRYYITPRAGAAFGSSIRMGHPSLYARLFARIF
jgi:hypothetical protein